MTGSETGNTSDMVLPSSRSTLVRALSHAVDQDPDRIVRVLTEAAQEVGAVDVTLFLADYQQLQLLPVEDWAERISPLEPVTVEGSMAGRSYETGETVAVKRAGQWVAWVPIRERADRIGVLSLRLPTWNPEIEEFCMRLGLLAAALVISSLRHTDHLHRARRRSSLSLAAELQWSMLPPLAYEAGGTTVAGLLEPAYDIGGDCFDYAMNNGVLHFGIFDAMGHGLSSAMLSALTLGAYRNARREWRTLPEVAAEVNETIYAQYAGTAFCTAILGYLDARSGRLRWINAGHPEPVLMRAHRAQRLEAVIRPPLGLSRISVLEQPREVVLEPDDGVLLYTDGVTESRSVGGEWFGEDRLFDLAEREVASGFEPAEVVRRLLRASLDHQGGGAQRDDAALVYLHWAGGPTPDARPSR